MARRCGAFTLNVALVGAFLACSLPLHGALWSGTRSFTLQAQRTQASGRERVTPKNPAVRSQNQPPVTQDASSATQQPGEIEKPSPFDGGTQNADQHPAGKREDAAAEQGNGAAATDPLPKAATPAATGGALPRWEDKLQQYGRYVPPAVLLLSVFALAVVLVQRSSLTGKLKVLEERQDKLQHDVEALSRRREEMQERLQSRDGQIQRKEQPQPLPQTRDVPSLPAKGSSVAHPQRRPPPRVTGDVSTGRTEVEPEATPSVLRPNRPIQAPEPARTEPAPVWMEAPVRPQEPTPAPAWQKTGDVLADYALARELGQMGSDQFLRSYACLGLSCVNPEARRFDPTAVLRFEQSARGMFLGVEQDGQVLVLPALDKDFASARTTFEAAFAYVDHGGTRACVVRPAVCTRTGDGWVMQRSGEVELV